MEKSQRELESLVNSQQKQLARYETRLKGKGNLCYAHSMGLNNVFVCVFL